MGIALLILTFKDNLIGAVFPAPLFLPEFLTSFGATKWKSRLCSKAATARQANYIALWIVRKREPWHSGFPHELVFSR